MRVRHVVAEAAPVAVAIGGGDDVAGSADATAGEESTAGADATASGVADAAAAAPARGDGSMHESRTAGAPMTKGRNMGSILT